MRALVMNLLFIPVNILAFALMIVYAILVLLPSFILMALADIIGGTNLDGKIEYNVRWMTFSSRTRWPYRNF